MKLTGAELLVKALKEENVDVLFAYPGGQVIDIFNALYGEADIDIIIPRHEQGLVHAADGYARSTGKTGVCLVTSGPGATNLVTGIATANYDCVPLVCLTGQVATNLMGTDSFQEADIVNITRSICKYAITVKRREDLADTIKKAFHIAKTGKPGVVVVDLPKDIQQAPGSGYYPLEDSLSEDQSKKVPETTQIEKVWEKLKNAQKPLFLVGGGVKLSHACGELLKLIETTGIPVVTTIMGKGAIPTTHKLYVGNVGIHGCYGANSAISNCDVLFAIGTRFSDRITGKKEQFAPKAAILHVDIDPSAISKNVPADISIVADARHVICALLEKAVPLSTSPWLKQIDTWKRNHPLDMENSGMTPRHIMEQINETFDDAIIATDVGQNQLWATQFLELDVQKQLLTSGGFGTMGYGLPAAIGAKIGNPDKNVLVISGDGGLQMNIQELATAVILELPLIICLLNNGYLGNVRQWQEMFFQKHYSGTCTRRRKSCPTACNAPGKNCPEFIPDFVRLAESYGARGIRVTKETEIRNALEEAKRNTKTPTLIEFIIDRETNVMPIVPPGHSLDHMIL